MLGHVMPLVMEMVCSACPLIVDTEAIHPEEGRRKKNSINNKQEKKKVNRKETKQKNKKNKMTMIKSIEQKVQRRKVLEKIVTSSHPHLYMSIICLHAMVMSMMEHVAIVVSFVLLDFACGCAVVVWCGCVFLVVCRGCVCDCVFVDVVVLVFVLVCS